MKPVQWMIAVMWLNSSYLAGTVFWFYVKRCGSLDLFFVGLTFFPSEPWFAVIHFGLTLLLFGIWARRKAGQMIATNDV